eukprot:362825-Chlamydomonas_euryale.AAC.4
MQPASRRGCPRAHGATRTAGARDGCRTTDREKDGPGKAVAVRGKELRPGRAAGGRGRTAAFRQRAPANR